MNGYAAHSIYRDAPVETIRMFIPEGSSIYYQCSVCKERLMFANGNVVEDFIDEHEHCGETA
jgi:hypothetical protein